MEPREGAAVSEPEGVGSVGQEAAKLLRALAASSHPPSSGAVPDEDHSCPTGWCPICQVVGFVREHPEVVERATATATGALLALRDFLLDSAQAPHDPSPDPDPSRRPS